MHRFVLFITLALTALSQPLSAGATEDASRRRLAELDSLLDRRDTYYMNHTLRIDSVKEIVRLNPLASPQEKAQLYHSIYTLYSSFQGDSAMVYANREMDEIRNSDNVNAYVQAVTDLLQGYISRGQWTAAQKTADGLIADSRLNRADSSLKGDFYFMCNRLYNDMSNWNDGSFTDEYARRSFEYCDSVMKYSPKGSFKAVYARVAKTLPGLNTYQKIDIFQNLMNRHDIGDSDKAMISSVLGDLYYNQNDIPNTLIHKIESAILDIKGAKRETTSKNFLAQLMFEQGDVDRASRYINAALDDAEFFNAPQRKAEISNVLPLIERARYMEMNRRNTALWWVLAIVVVVLVALAFMSWKIVKQRDQLRQRNSTILRQNEELDRANKQNDEQNAQLRSTLAKYRESVKIKDEYIGYGFYLNSQYIAKMERLYKMINRKLAARQYDDLKMSLKEQDLRKEKDEMRREFDRTFLNLFPSFVEQYNALFPENEGVTPPDANTLTPEMRIFALIRLGITDISSIATFLNYSVNTVNTYKTKAKNRSNVPNESFEAEIMNIKSAE